MATLSEQIKFSTCRSVEDRLDEKVKGKVVNITVVDNKELVKVAGIVDRLAITCINGVLEIAFMVGGRRYTTPLWYFLNNCKTSTQSKGKIVESNSMKEQLIAEGLDISAIAPADEEELDIVLNEDDED